MYRKFITTAYWIFTLEVNLFYLSWFKVTRVFGASEDDYVRRYTNQEYVVWDQARKLYSTDRIALENLCLNAHRKSGKGKIKADGDLFGLVLKPQRLQLNKNWTYNPIKIDVLSYWYKEREFYLTKGLSPGCVYYLRLSKTYPGRFRLVGRQVCGVSEEIKTQNTTNRRKFLCKNSKCYMVFQSRS